MLVRHPRGNRIGGRTEDDLDAGLAHRVHDAVHPRVLELTVFRLPQAPGGLAHADHVEAGGLHQGDILFEAGGLIAGHVLVVVGGAVEHGWEGRDPCRTCSRRWHSSLLWIDNLCWCCKTQACGQSDNAAREYIFELQHLSRLSFIKHLLALQLVGYHSFKGHKSLSRLRKTTHWRVCSLPAEPSANSAGNASPLSPNSARCSQSPDHSGAPHLLFCTHILSDAEE